MGLAAWILNLEGEADVTAPTLLSAVVAADGNSITFAFDEAVSIGVGGNGGWTITPSGGAATLTYSSGDGSTALVYSTSRAIAESETGTIAYTQPTDGVEDAAGNDLATIASAAFSTGSTSTSGRFGNRGRHRGRR